MNSDNYYPGGPPSETLKIPSINFEVEFKKFINIFSSTRPTLEYKCCAIMLRTESNMKFVDAIVFKKSSRTRLQNAMMMP